MSAGDVVDHQCHLAVLVVNSGYGFIFLLAGGVPKLELDLPALHRVHLLEVDRPQGGIQAFVELVVYEADGDAALADAHGANHDHLSR